VDLRQEFENNRFLRAMGDPEDFIEWLGCKKFFFLCTKDIKALPVFGRFSIEFTTKMVAPREYKNPKWQACLDIKKDTPFLQTGSRLVGMRESNKKDALLKALLALWELETHRKVNAVKDAFDIDRIKPLSAHLRRDQDNLPTYFF